VKEGDRIKVVANHLLVDGHPVANVFLGRTGYVQWVDSKDRCATVVLDDLPPGPEYVGFLVSELEVLP
jgi:ribosomal protein L21E